MYYTFFFSLHGDHRDLHVLTHPSPTRRSSDLVGGAAHRLAGEVVDHPLRPLLGARLAVRLDDRAEQRLVVDVGAAADADLALPLRISEILVGLDLAGLDLGFVVDRKSTRLNSSH